MSAVLPKVDTLSICEIYTKKNFLSFYNGLIINNGSQKHNYIRKYNNLPTTCFDMHNGDDNP